MRVSHSPPGCVVRCSRTSSLCTDVYIVHIRFMSRDSHEREVHLMVNWGWPLTLVVYQTASLPVYIVIVILTDWIYVALIVGGWDLGLCVVLNLFYDCAAKSIMSVMVVHSFVVCIYIIYRICDFFFPSIQITRYLDLRNSIYKSREFDWFWHKIIQNDWNELLVLIAKKTKTTTQKRRLKFW